ncbi:MAG: RNA recognition motif domain-containing protein [Planctomycetota bacterium]
MLGGAGWSSSASADPRIGHSCSFSGSAALIRFEPASAPAAGVVLMQRIYVGNLSFQTTEQTLSDLFAEHGKVEGVSIITDRITGRSRGFAFVEMADSAEAKAAMEALNGREFDGRPLRVAEAKERADSR